LQEEKTAIGKRVERLPITNANQQSNPKTAQATLAKIKAISPADERTFEAL